jgi:3-oxoacyl-(acyl-carrier-protein) synthase
MFLKRVVVTGLGTINPIGNNVESYFSSLDRGKGGFKMIDRFDTTLFKSKFAAEIDGYNPEDHGFDRKEARKNDRYCQYALIAASQAIADSHLVLEEENPTRVGVVVGTGIGGHREPHCRHQGFLYK